MTLATQAFLRLVVPEEGGRGRGHVRSQHLAAALALAAGGPQHLVAALAPPLVLFIRMALRLSIKYVNVTQSKKTIMQANHANSV